MSPLHVVVLAAGQGKRMGSGRPKVLVKLADKPLISHVLENVDEVNPDATHVVVGFGADEVRDECSGDGRNFVHQAEQLGTGHAASLALASIDDEATVVVLLGDAPLVTPETIRRAGESGTNQVSIVSAHVDDPAGYGRIVRDHHGVNAIVEHKDASDDQRAITEINSGMLAAPAGLLRELLANVDRSNAQGEFYLTDVVAGARKTGQSVGAIIVDAEEIVGANDRWQLAQLERLFQRRSARALTAQGARIADPDRIDVRGTVTIDGDVFIDVNVVFEGDVQLGDGVHIGPNCYVKNAHLGPGTVIHAMSHIEGAITEGACNVGPFARLRPGTRLAEDTRVGNFVETKNVELGMGSKASHLTYLGDARIGANVNIGAGTITCNYDGVNKHRTTIGDGAFIGSGTQLVAPVNVGSEATIGAGSVISNDAPDGQLTVARARARTLSGWKRPENKEKP